MRWDKEAAEYIGMFLREEGIEYVADDLGYGTTFYLLVDENAGHDYRYARVILHKDRNNEVSCAYGPCEERYDTLGHNIIYKIVFRGTVINLCDPGFFVKLRGFIYPILYGKRSELFPSPHEIITGRP